MAEAMAVDEGQANLPNGRTIYDLITANNLDGIHALLNPLTLRHRQSIVCQNVHDETLLGRACELGFRDIVKYLVDECEACISECYPFPQIWLPPVLVSIANLDVPMLLLLISRGALTVDKLEARTCAVYAATKELPSMESLLYSYIHKIKQRKRILELTYALSSGVEIDLDNPELMINASGRGDTSRMKTLLAFGANAKGTNVVEENSLCSAIVNKQSSAEHLLLNYRVFSPKNHVRALELAGAKFIAFKSRHEEGVRCWRKSLRIRNEHFFGVSDKFQNRLKTSLGVEFSCEAELDKMADREEDLYVQALIVSVRLLSPSSEVLQNAFIVVAHQFVFLKDLIRAIDILSQLSEFPHKPESGHVYPFQRATGAAVSLFRSHFHSNPSDPSYFRFDFRSLMNFISEVNWKVLLRRQGEFHIKVYTELLSLVVWKTIAMKNYGFGTSDEVWVKDGISKILRFHSDPYPTSLLHLAIKEPYAYSVIPFILSCSADANCTDAEKNTPLHMVPLLPIDTTCRLHLVNLLTDAGGHIDSVNDSDTTPLEGLKDNDVIENPLKFLSLQCLAAQTIHKYNIKVPDIYPKILRSFIKLHSR